jgi:serralysin
MAAQNWTLKQVLDQLNSGSLWTSNQITYSFPTSASDMYTGSGEAGGFEALSNVQITFAEYALAGWDDLMQNDFVQASGSTHIEIANTTTGIDYAHAYFPKTGSVWFNNDYDDVKTPVIGDYGYLTFIHELGHALGLDHMGEYNGSGSWAPSSYQDTTVLSVMSYFGPDHGDDGKNSIMWADWVKNGTTYSAQTPMLNDVMAIQAMYGVETTTRTGATTYGFNSNITGSAAQIFDFDINENPILCIFDSSGNDTLDLSGFSSQSSISLVAGSFSDCNQMTNNISIAYTAVIENAVGGSADDTITGNDVANMLTGGRGNDHIDGADGNDIAIFSGAYANYTIKSLGTGSYTVTDNIGNDGVDTLTSIEILRFSDRDVGSSDNGTAPTVAAPLADQTTDTDTYFSFVIPGSTFTDPNGDALVYTATLEGGGALPGWLTFDAATRTFSGTPGTADLATLSIVVTASDGSETVSDTFVLDVGGDSGSILLGSRNNDNLAGTADNEVIRGLAGRDKIYAGAGDDHIDGGKGRDALWGEDGADTFAFGGKNGMDDINDFSFADGDRIDLSGVKGITSYADLMNNHFFSLNGDAYIRVSKGHDILLLGVDANAMTEADFIF